MQSILYGLLAVPVRISEDGYWDMVNERLSHIKYPSNVFVRISWKVMYRKKYSSARIDRYVSDMIIQCENRILQNGRFSSTDKNFFRRFLRLSQRLFRPLRETNLYYLIGRLHSIQRRFTVILSQRILSR
jgi:hypothetical protein